jgi:hypothetical protein
VTEQRWTAETEELVVRALYGRRATAAVDGFAEMGWDRAPLSADARRAWRVRAGAILTVLADAGLLAVPGTTGDAEAWRHNAKLHNDMRRRIARVMTHAAAEQRTLSWVADELADILDDPRAWCGETTVDTEETKP